jgi:hypothetical protein
MDYELEEQQEDLQDVQQEIYETQADDISNIPTAKKSQDLYSLFDKVRRTEDSTKVSNVDNKELGKLDITIRDAQKIALIANTFHHKRFASFFNALGEITLASSASKKGWFVELFVTNKRFSTKSKGSSFNPQDKKKWSLFNRPEEPQEN